MIEAFVVAIGALREPVQPRRWSARILTAPGTIVADYWPGDDLGPEFASRCAASSGRSDV